VPKDRRRFTREDPDSRKDALIRATLSLMAARGPSAVTVRAIAEEAGVTQGMIRHYFSSKQDLMNAAYQAHMQVQTEMSQATHDSGGGTARQRLARLIHASVTPPVAEPMALSLWAGFIHMVRRDLAMRVTHEKTYLHYRDLLQMMITAAIAETGRKVSTDEARSLAIACNAVIDGLWLEGGALPDAFGSDELSQIGLRSVEAIIGLSLTGERA
jgi:AcrR family transcriptional regulator